MQNFIRLVVLGLCWTCIFSAVASEDDCDEESATTRIMKSHFEDHNEDEEECDSSPIDPKPGAEDWVLLAANDLGMHCADTDFQIMSILPPFNVVHAQLIQKGINGHLPELLDDQSAKVSYRASSNAFDPVSPSSVNTSSLNSLEVFKSNFWELSDEGHSLALENYGVLYPGQHVLGLCEGSSFNCESALALFDPLGSEQGLPVPDVNHLPELAIAQQAMPGAANDRQEFAKFDKDIDFFVQLPFGKRIQNVNWFAAEGIPILPVDDSGKLNPYPLMRLEAFEANQTLHIQSVKTSLDIVLPVADEADCFNCHASVSDSGNGSAAEFALNTMYANGIEWDIALEESAPPPQKLQNAAKINILRLHDAKHGEDYVSTIDGTPIPCLDGSEPSCLDQRRPIQCSECHYTPALDLAQTGPIDEPEQGQFGRQQTRHVSMSRAMHYSHGNLPDFMGEPLFPAMPAPDDVNRTTELVKNVLDQTCYQCHPGKQTQCLRGAMGSAGVVCQDCHGDMQQVGNDFSMNLPQNGMLDLNKRIPWAHEPGCQSCHIGDVVQIQNLDTSDYIMAEDQIRLLQSYKKSDQSSIDLKYIEHSQSRFAENESLYRLSSGHGGLMCEACHGSTHAIWPVNGAQASVSQNDNLASIQLQGHTGTLIECDTCHEPGSLGLTLDGPHGMHPVNDPNWTDNHEDIAEHNLESCQSCHGLEGEGTVLSRMAMDRVLEADHEIIHLKKGDQVSCDLCHENPMTDEDD